MYILDRLMLSSVSTSTESSVCFVKCFSICPCIVNSSLLAHSFIG